MLTDRDGPGIPEGELEAVLQPFVCVEMPRSKQTGGSGLGPFIASDLVTKQGGEFHLSNPESGGPCVRITLPVKTSHVTSS